MGTAASACPGAELLRGTCSKCRAHHKLSRRKASCASALALAVQLHRSASSRAAPCLLVSEPDPLRILELRTLYFASKRLRTCGLPWGRLDDQAGGGGEESATVRTVRSIATGHDCRLFPCCWFQEARLHCLLFATKLQLEYPICFSGRLILLLHFTCSGNSRRPTAPKYRHGGSKAREWRHSRSDEACQNDETVLIEQLRPKPQGLRTITVEFSVAASIKMSVVPMKTPRKVSRPDAKCPVMLPDFNQIPTLKCCCNSVPRLI
jgi:hypothetical protein